MISTPSPLSLLYLLAVCLELFSISRCLQAIRTSRVRKISTSNIVEMCLFSPKSRQSPEHDFSQYVFAVNDDVSRQTVCWDPPCIKTCATARQIPFFCQVEVQRCHIYTSNASFTGDKTPQVLFYTLAF